MRWALVIVLAPSGPTLAGCGWDPWAGWEHPTSGATTDAGVDPCCTANAPTNYSCLLTLTVASCPAATCTKPTRCNFDQTFCATSAADAEAQALTWAKARNPDGQSTPLGAMCNPTPCLKKRTPRRYVPPLDDLPTEVPLDYPSCESLGVMVCVANVDSCMTDADCCSGICSEWGACETCRALAEGCMTDADCCSGICSLNACGGA
jgi:hypothetical protein